MLEYLNYKTEVENVHRVKFDSLSPALKTFLDPESFRIVMFKRDGKWNPRVSLMNKEFGFGIQTDLPGVWSLETHLKETINNFSKVVSRNSDQSGIISDRIIYWRTKNLLKAYGL